MKVFKRSKAYGALEYTIIIALIIVIAIIFLILIRNKALTPSWLDKAQGAVSDFIGAGPGGPVDGGNLEDLGDKYLIAEFYQEFNNVPDPSDFYQGMGVKNNDSENSFNLFLEKNNSLDNIGFELGDDPYIFDLSPSPEKDIKDILFYFMKYSSFVKNQDEEVYLNDFCTTCYFVQITRIITISQNKAENPDYYTSEISFIVVDSDNNEVKSKNYKIKINTKNKLDFDIFCLSGRLINVPEESKGVNFRILLFGDTLAVIGHNKKLYISNDEGFTFELAEASKDVEISIIGENQGNYSKLFASNKEVYGAEISIYRELEKFSKINFETPLDSDEEIIKIVDTFVFTNKYLYAYGSNPHGRLGTGDTSDNSVLKKVKGVGGSGYMPTNIKKIETSFSDFRNTAILTNEGKVLISGQRFDGAIGDGLNNSTNTGGFFVKPNIDESIVFIDIAHFASMTIALTNDNKLYLWGGGILIPREFNLNGEQITRLYSVESGFSGSFGFLAVNNEDKAFKLEFDNNPLNDKLELASNNFSYSIFNGNKSVEKKEKVRLIDYFGEEKSTLDNCLSIDKIYYFNSSNNYIIAKMLDGKIRIIRFDVSPPLG